MKKLYYCLFALLQMALQANAQLDCGNDILAKKLQESHPELLDHIRVEKENWYRYNKGFTNAKMKLSGSDTSYEVPVVFHIVHTGAAIGTEYNPDDATIDSVLVFLNKTWAAAWPSYPDTGHGGVQVPIQFVLAKRDPNCNPTTGINRVNGSLLAGYKSNGICPFGSVPGPSDAQVKNLSVWPSRDYLNIWVVNKIEAGALAGYAPWPWYTSDEILDGVVISAANIQMPTVLGDYPYTLPHEVGHSFGLYHTFQDGCDGTASCLVAGDQICDTEPHNFVSYSCDTGKVNTCTSVAFNGVEHNFMNYSTCANRFTKDQCKRILYTLKGYRMGLVASLGGTDPDPTFVPPVPSLCIPTVLQPSNTLDIGPCNVIFSNLSSSSSGYNTDGYLCYIDRTCMQEAAIVTAGDTFLLSISTRNYPQNVTAWIDYNNDGKYDLSELVLSHTGTIDSEIHEGRVIIPKTGVVREANLRFRIMADYLSIPSACTDLLYGQAEDYSLIVKGSTSIRHLAYTTALPQLFPNPANDIVYVRSSNPLTIMLMTADGRVVLHAASTNQLQLGGLENGLYFACFYDSHSGTYIGVQKLLKQ